MDFPQAVAEVLRKAECQHLFTVEHAKLKCKLNGHCIPMDNVGVIERFVGGKKFKKLAGQLKDAQQLQKFEPFLVPSKRLKDHLFCALTGQLIKANFDAARKHMKGQRFLKAKERFMEDDMDLLEEPEDAAKPERRAQHRLQRGSASAAELRAPAEEPAADADTSDAAGASSGDEAHEAHALMDELLESDDSVAADEAEAAAASGAASDGVDGREPASGQQLAATGKRKRAPQSAVGSSAARSGGQKRTKVDEQLAGLNVTGANKLLAKKKVGCKEAGAAGAGPVSVGNESKKGGSDKKRKQKQKKGVDKSVLGGDGTSRKKTEATGSAAKGKDVDQAQVKTGRRAGAGVSGGGQAQAGAGEQLGTVKAGGGQKGKVKQSHGKA